MEIKPEDTETFLIKREKELLEVLDKMKAERFDLQARKVKTISIYNRLYRLRKSIYRTKGKLSLIFEVLGENHFEEENKMSQNGKQKDGRTCQKCNYSFVWMCFREATKKEKEMIAEWEEGVPYEPKTTKDWKNAILCETDGWLINEIDISQIKQEACGNCKVWLQKQGVKLSG